MSQVSAGGGRTLLSDWLSEQGHMAAAIDQFHHEAITLVSCFLLRVSTLCDDEFRLNVRKRVM